MSRKTKNILIWVITVVLIICGAWGYGYSKVGDEWVWQLERAIVFGFGLLYLSAFARLLIGMFKR